MARYIHAFRAPVARAGSGRVPSSPVERRDHRRSTMRPEPPVRDVLSGPAPAWPAPRWRPAGRLAVIATSTWAAPAPTWRSSRHGPPGLALRARDRRRAGARAGARHRDRRRGRRVDRLARLRRGAEGGPARGRRPGAGLLRAGRRPGRRSPTPTWSSAGSARGLLGGECRSIAARAEAAAGAGGCGAAPLDAAAGILGSSSPTWPARPRADRRAGRGPARTSRSSPFGGAGPLHAGALPATRDPRILVPPAPGILCALGLLVEDLRADAVRTWVGPLHARGPAGPRRAIPRAGGRGDRMARPRGHPRGATRAVPLARPPL